jgi:DNA polymerase-1
MLEQMLGEKELVPTYTTTELPLVLVLASMETAGISVDRDQLKVVQKQLGEKIDTLAHKIFKSVGTTFNLNSPRELSGVLYGTLKLGTGRIKKLKSGFFSTDAEQLEKLQGRHEAVDLILRWRELSKLESTYAAPLERFIDAQDGRIHTTFMQTGTATGRLSSETPNLQNIPKRGDDAGVIRSLFLSAPGYTLLSCDYSQIELRIMANLSGDRELIRAFQSGSDIHRATAALIWNVPMDQVDAKLRFRAKALNFGILYGMGPRAMAQRAGVSMQEAKNFMDDYFLKFSGVKEYIDRTVVQARERGYTETLWGRRRFFPRLYSGKPHLVAESERMAVNMTTQGFVADIMKRAMTRAFREIVVPSHDGARLLLQIHDELLFEVKDEILSETARHVKAICESVYEDAVPLVAVTASGKRWSEVS